MTTSTILKASVPMTTDEIRKLTGRVPRVSIACLPTPLHAAPRLAKELGGPRIFIKRDDLTGAAFGGNKLRNLEFRMAAVLEMGADTIIADLDQQSNSARQTTAAANKLGLKTILILEGQCPDEIQGNLLVNYLLGADVRFAPDTATQLRMVEEAMDEVRRNGGTPCHLTDIPMFDEGSAIAYIENAVEILDELRADDIEPTCLFMSSSGKGQAGHILAKELLNASFEVRGIAATDKFDIPPRAASIANRAARRLGLDIEIDPAVVDSDENFVGEGYGIPSEAGNEAVRLFARTEGVLLDPIYTGKCAAGMVEHIRRGDFSANDTVVFVHTGGTPAIFTHNHLWAP